MSQATSLEDRIFDEGSYSSLGIATLIVLLGLFGFGAFVGFVSIDFFTTNLIVISNGFQIIYDLKTMFYLLYLSILMAIGITFSILRILAGVREKEEMSGICGSSSTIIGIIIIVVIFITSGFTIFFQIIKWIILVGTWVAFIGLSVIFVGLIVVIAYSSYQGWVIKGI